MAWDPLGGVVVGAFIGASFGSAIGIAGFGTAIAGTVPFGILGAWLGYRHSNRAMPDDVEVRNTGGVLKYVKDVVILVLDLLILFLLFIKKLLQKPNQ